MSVSFPVSNSEDDGYGDSDWQSATLRPRTELREEGVPRRGSGTSSRTGDSERLPETSEPRRLLLLCFLPLALLCLLELVVDLCSDGALETWDLAAWDLEEE